jgi:hypothetical protein
MEATTSFEIFLYLLFLYGAISKGLKISCLLFVKGHKMFKIIWKVSTMALLEDIVEHFLILGKDK